MARKQDLRAVIADDQARLVQQVNERFNPLIAEVDGKLADYARRVQAAMVTAMEREARRFGAVLVKTAPDVKLGRPDRNWSGCYLPETANETVRRLTARRNQLIEQRDRRIGEIRQRGAALMRELTLYGKTTGLIERIERFAAGKPE
jgi:hypothetical protein